jgi:hypothetical protein
MANQNLQQMQEHSTKCYTIHHMYNLQVFVLIITGLDTNKPNVHLTTSKPNKKISVL